MALHLLVFSHIEFYHLGYHYTINAPKASPTLASTGIISMPEVSLTAKMTFYAKFKRNQVVISITGQESPRPHVDMDVNIVIILMSQVYTLALFNNACLRYLFKAEKAPGKSRSA